MKVALVVPGGVDRGGQERVVPAFLWLLERLARRHDLRVYALAQEREPCVYPLLGATVENLALRGRSDWPRVLGRLATSLRRNGPFALFHALGGDTPGFLATAAGRFMRTPVLVHLCGGELARVPEIGYGSQLSFSGRFQVAFTRKHATRLTAASQALARPTGAALVPLGVERSFQRPVETRREPPWRLLQIGSLNRVKDQSTLLRALRRVVVEEPRTHLDLAGVDTLDGAVNAEAERLGVAPHVTFHGLLRSGDVRALLGGKDLLVVSSRHEAGPVAAMEAAMAGVPVVGTAVGHLADWAPDAAEAVPVGDDEALARAIVTLLRSPERREALARKAQVYAVAHDADWTAARFDAIYAEIGT